jgi:Ca2+:H+ antiporter
MVHQSRSSREHRRPSPAYAGERRSRDQPSSSREYTTEKVRTSRDRRQSLPQYNHNGHEVTKGMHPDGESGRKGFNPIKFLVICGRSSSKLSMLTNCLWPMVPVAIALVSGQCQFDDLHTHDNAALRPA